MTEPHRPRTVFMGSPDFALPILSQLAAAYPVVGVLTQPDRPAGRGRSLTPPPVKGLADSLGIPTIQPARLRQPEAFAQLEAWQPELIVVAAFGQILRQNVLDLPRFGCINVHASLLPRWRGAAPIQASLLHGDAQSGVTIMKMDAGIDTGDILSQRPVVIQPEDNAETLSERLAVEGADLLVQTLPAYLAGQIEPQPQPVEGATYAAMLKKEDGQLDFWREAAALERQVRAFYPWPGSFFGWGGQAVKVLRAKTLTDCDLTPDQTAKRGGLPVIGCASGCLALLEVQPAGKKPMPGAVFLNGARGWGQQPVERLETE